MGGFHYPSPHQPDAPPCEAVDPAEGERCQLLGRHMNKPHMAATATAVLVWGRWWDEVIRQPRHTIPTWIAFAPWRPELRP